MMRATADQTLSNAVHTQAAYDTTLLNNGTGLSLSGNTVVVNEAGTYRIAAQACFGTSSTGYRQVRIDVNGAVYNTKRLNASNAGGTYGVLCEWVGDLEVGNVIESTIQQTSGGDLDTASGSDTSDYNFLLVYRIGQGDKGDPGQDGQDGQDGEGALVDEGDVDNPPAGLLPGEFLYDPTAEPDPAWTPLTQDMADDLYAPIGSTGTGTVMQSGTVYVDAQGTDGGVQSYDVVYPTPMPNATTNIHVQTTNSRFNASYSTAQPPTTEGFRLWLRHLTGTNGEDTTGVPVHWTAWADGATTGAGFGEKVTVVTDSNYPDGTGITLSRFGPIVTAHIELILSATGTTVSPDAVIPVGWQPAINTTALLNTSYGGTSPDRESVALTFYVGGTMQTFTTATGCKALRGTASWRTDDEYPA
jgi:hypothetical protein